MVSLPILQPWCLGLSWGACLRERCHTRWFSHAFGSVVSRVAQQWKVAPLWTIKQVLALAGRVGLNMWFSEAHGGT